MRRSAARRTLALALGHLVPLAMLICLPACRDLEEAVGGPAAVMLIVHDPADPECLDDARIAWALDWPFENDFTTQKWLSAIPETQTPNPGGMPPACAYSAALTVPGESLDGWRLRAVDEASWVATCGADFTETPPGSHNVVRFTRGTAGCVLNP